MMASTCASVSMPPSFCAKADMAVPAATLADDRPHGVVTRQRKVHRIADSDCRSVPPVGPVTCGAVLVVEHLANRERYRDWEPQGRVEVFREGDIPRLSTGRERVRTLRRREASSAFVSGLTFLQEAGGFDAGAHREGQVFRLSTACCGGRRPDPPRHRTLLARPRTSTS